MYNYYYRALQDASSQDVCQRFACVSGEEECPKGHILLYLKEFDVHFTLKLFESKETMTAMKVYEGLEEVFAAALAVHSFSVHLH